MATGSGPSRAAGGGPALVLAAVEALPPLPAVALRVMQVAQDARSSASDLAIVVSADPGLSARILRMANSVVYRRGRAVTSVQDALVRLGFVLARNVAVSGAIAGAYTPVGGNELFRIEAFWRHSIAVAFRASELAGKSRRIDVPTAFTAGILHNIGRLAMFYADATGLERAVAQALATGTELEAIESVVPGYDHAEVGGILADRWQLPDDVIEAIRGHHRDHEGEVSVAAVVAQANRFCTDRGLLPGYTVPGATNGQGQPPDDFLRLMKQVEALVQLVVGPHAGLHAA